MIHGSVDAKEVGDLVEGPNRQNACNRNHIYKLWKNQLRLALLDRLQNLGGNFGFFENRQEPRELGLNSVEHAGANVVRANSQGVHRATFHAQLRTKRFHKTKALMVKAITPLFREHRKGHIVLITSTAAHRTYENGGSYAAAKFGEASLVDTLRLELNGEPIRVTEIAPGIVKTEEFAKIRYKGNIDAAAKIYEGIEKPLVAEDVAEAIRWVVMLPDHFNVDSMMIKPLAQAVSHKVYRKPIR